MVGVDIAPKQGHNPWWRRALYATVICAALVGVGVWIDRVVIGPPLAPTVAKPRRPKQIPVSAAACSDVSALYNAAEDVRIEMDYAVAGFAPLDQLTLPFPRLVRVSWQTSRTRLDTRLRALDGAIARSAPDFPKTIRDQFAIVRRSIAVGRPELATSRRAVELLAENGRRWSDAVRAFGTASDLVGTQCGRPLGSGEPLFGPCSITDCSKP